ncbi:MAG TPA: FeoB small GTPase domain-containing protein, partial [Phycisphaerae bacterium]|nr:FeoB small GTPase domain-containing protein [Phycisphaerae bacterium]
MPYAAGEGRASAGTDPTSRTGGAAAVQPADVRKVAGAAGPRVALLGNPNTGKTCVFNLLTGARRRVSNYPGVTVERAA